MTEKYGIKEMVNDFVNPAQYTKTSELADKGVLTIVSTIADESEEYGKSYKTTFRDSEGNDYLSFVSAKQPYAIFDKFKDKLADCKVEFNVVKLDTKKTILKMVLVEATPEYDKALKEFLKQ